MISANVVAGVVALVAIILALVTAIIGALTYYFNFASTSKQTRLRCGIDAYRAAMRLRWLADGAGQSRKADPDHIRSCLQHIEEDVIYYRAYLYVESEPVADAYQRFTEALYNECRPIITNTPSTSNLASNTKRQQHPLCEALRRDYLVEVRKTASFYRLLRSIRLVKPVREPPKWL